MQGSVARKGKWILARKRLDVFLGYLHPDREQAGERYEQIPRILVTLFKCNGCPSAEDAVDETIDRVIRRLGEVEVDNLMGFNDTSSSSGCIIPFPLSMCTAMRQKPGLSVAWYPSSTEGRKKFHLARYLSQFRAETGTGGQRRNGALHSMSRPKHETAV